jgi:hypothetical protein
LPAFGRAADAALEAVLVKRKKRGEKRARSGINVTWTAGGRQNTGGLYANKDQYPIHSHCQLSNILNATEFAYRLTEPAEE